MYDGFCPAYALLKVCESYKNIVVGQILLGSIPHKKGSF